MFQKISSSSIPTSSSIPITEGKTITTNTITANSCSSNVVASSKSTPSQENNLRKLLFDHEKLSITDNSLKERIEASCLLTAVGDSIGYRNGSWEFNFSGERIHKELKEEFDGKIANIDTKTWKVSDDTIFHLATLKTLNHKDLEQVLIPKLNIGFKDQDFMKIVDKVMVVMVQEYVACWKDMTNRSPGKKCRESISFIKQTRKNKWDSLNYDPRGGGCGGSMRAMSIGLCFHDNLDMLIAIGIESGRLTHNHVVGFMGALQSALFTAFAIKQIEPKLWGVLFLEFILPKCKFYLKNVSKRNWKSIELDLISFEEKFKKYLGERMILSISDENLDKVQPQFPEKYGVVERDKFYKSYSFSGWAGSSGDDSIIVAYDALLSSGPNQYEQLVKRACLHGGDSDTTGAIALSWYGALYGFSNVPEKNYKNIEKISVLKRQSQKMIEKIERDLENFQL